MKLYYNGKEVGEVLTNRSMTIVEALWSIGYDINDEDDLEKAYNDGFPAAYKDDNGEYAIDFDGLEMVY